MNIIVTWFLNLTCEINHIILPNIKFAEMLEPTELNEWNWKRNKEPHALRVAKQSRASDRFGAGSATTPPPLTPCLERGAGSGHQVQGDVELGGTDRFSPRTVLSPILHRWAKAGRLSDSGMGGCVRHQPMDLISAIELRPISALGDKAIMRTSYRACSLPCIRADTGSIVW